jgi:Transcriptional Coactivator p15 (PC4)
MRLRLDPMAADTDAQSRSKLLPSREGVLPDETIVVVASWPKNQRQTFRVSLDRFRGKEVVTLRVWFAGNDGTERPTKAGITVAVRHLPKIAAELARALDVARDHNLIVDTDGEALG